VVLSGGVYSTVWKEHKLQQIELENGVGFRVGLLDYGATIQSICVPADDGNLNAVLAYPDAPNKPHFPSAELKPGEEYRQSILYEFGFDTDSWL